MESAEYEKWIHNIYLKHYKNPISNSEWNKRIQNIPKQHKLKYKDNLWDLSGSFLKDSLYWSKLWVINPEVENPHLIYKGNSIKFDPLALSQVNKSKLSVDIQDQFPGLVLPPVFSKGALLEEKIPSSLPDIPIFIPFDDEIDLKQLQRSRRLISQPIPFYLSDETPDTAGEILGRDNYGKMFGVSGDKVILRLKDNISAGSHITVFKNKGKTGNFLSRLAGQSNEYEIQVKGVLKVISYIQGSGSLYKARVISAIDEMSAEDSIFKGSPLVYSFSDKTVAKGSGLIIGSPYKSRFFLTVGSIVFLNKGKADGLYKEAVYFIRPNKEMKNLFDRPYNYEGAILGKLKVIHVSQNKATAVILSAKDKVYVGDSFAGKISDFELEPIEESDSIEAKELLMDFEEIESDREEPSLETDEDQGLKEGERIDYELIEQEEMLEDPNIEKDIDLNEGFETDFNEMGDDFELEVEPGTQESLKDYEEDENIEDYYEVDTLEWDEELSKGKKEIKELNKGIKESREELEGLEEDLEEKEQKFEQLEVEVLEEEVKQKVEENEDLEFELDNNEFSNEDMDLEDFEEIEEESFTEEDDNSSESLEESDDELEEIEEESFTEEDDSPSESLEEPDNELEELEEIDTL